MTDQQARSVVSGAALVICSVIAALAWGQGAVLAVIVAGQVFLLLDRLDVHGRCDKATDDADLALGKTLAIEDHLSGIEPASTGRHGMTTTNYLEEIRRAS